jgi:hypothetical protein
MQKTDDSMDIDIDYKAIVDFQVFQYTSFLTQTNAFKDPIQVYVEETTCKPIYDEKTIVVVNKTDEPMYAEKAIVEVKRQKPSKHSGKNPKQITNEILESYWPVQLFQDKPDCLNNENDINSLLFIKQPMAEQSNTLTSFNESTLLDPGDFLDFPDVVTQEPTPAPSVSSSPQFSRRSLPDNLSDSFGHSDYVFLLEELKSYRWNLKTQLCDSNKSKEEKILERNIARPVKNQKFALFLRSFSIPTPTIFLWKS